ncbi:MAG: DNA endonuclease SmrA [bacterium]
MDDNADDESKLFAEAMSDVAPIEKGRPQTLKPSAQVTAAQLQRREAALGLNSDLADPNFLTLGDVETVDPHAVLEWKKVGVQNAVFDRLKRGGYEHQAQLDLHRKTVKEARALVFNFLRMAQAKDWRNLLISPGKGELSKTPGRLKSYVNHWLQHHPEVIAFSSATRRHGGVGAIYVMVRKSPASRELTREQHGFKSDETP